MRKHQFLQTHLNLSSDFTGDRNKISTTMSSDRFIMFFYWLIWHGNCKFNGKSERGQDRLWKMFQHETPILTTHDRSKLKLAGFHTYKHPGYSRSFSWGSAIFSTSSGSQRCFRSCSHNTRPDTVFQRRCNFENFCGRWCCQPRCILLLNNSSWVCI